MAVTKSQLKALKAGDIVKLRVGGEVTVGEVNHTASGVGVEFTGYDIETYHYSYGEKGYYYDGGIPMHLSDIAEIVPGQAKVSSELWWVFYATQTGKPEVLLAVGKEDAIAKAKELGSGMYGAHVKKILAITNMQAFIEGDGLDLLKGE